MTRWMSVVLVACLALPACSKSARLNRRCRGGDGAACAELAVRLALGRGAARNAAEAAQRLRDAARAHEKACDAGDLAACLALGESLQSATGVAQDDATAARVFEKACNGGNATACLRLALVTPAVDVAPGVAADPLQGPSSALLEKACDGGNATGCLELGRWHSMVGKEPNLVAAASLYRRACEGDEPIGCMWLGDLYSKGAGVPQDRAMEEQFVRRYALRDLVAVHTFERDCDQGRFTACLDFANRGLGATTRSVVPDLREASRQEAKAAQVLGQLCDAGFWTACTRLAPVYGESDSRIPPKDPARAMALYQQACDGGLWTACGDLAHLYLYGPTPSASITALPGASRTATALDTAKAAALYQRACDHGLRESCLMARSLTRPQEPQVDEPAGAVSEEDESAAAPLEEEAPE
jgi:TPR repeat protein